jgi:hypothetical protein
MRLSWAALPVHANMEVHGRDQEDDECSDLERKTSDNNLLASNSQLELHGPHDAGTYGWSVHVHLLML